MNNAPAALSSKTASSWGSRVSWWLNNITLSGTMSTTSGAKKTTVFRQMKKMDSNTHKGNRWIPMEKNLFQTLGISTEQLSFWVFFLHIYVPNLSLISPFGFICCYFRWSLVQWSTSWSSSLVVLGCSLWKMQGFPCKQFASVDAMLTQLHAHGLNAT